MVGMKSGIASLAIAGGFVFAAVVGCSASGSDAPVDDTTPTDPNGGSSGTAQLPPPSNPPGQDPPPNPPPPPTDAGKDSAVDAGPPPPTPGTACTTPNKIVSKACGACGTQQTLCLDPGDGGTPAWTDYSACTGELAGGCVPGTTSTESCGNCGTVTKTCSKYCAWNTPACTGQPVNSCSPLSVDLSSAGCATAGTFRQRSCKTDCTYDNFSASCTAPPTTIQVGTGLGSESSTVVEFSATTTIARLSGFSCPQTIGTNLVPYEYVTVHNPNAKSATVTIYNSAVTGGSVIATQMATYPGTGQPTDRKACTKYNDFGDDTITGDSSFASLSDTDSPVIPANGSILVYVAMDQKVSATNPAGPVKLTVRLDALK